MCGGCNGERTKYLEGKSEVQGAPTRQIEVSHCYDQECIEKSRLHTNPQIPRRHNTAPKGDNRSGLPKRPEQYDKSCDNHDGAPK